MVQTDPEELEEAQQQKEQEAEEAVTQGFIHTPYEIKCGYKWNAPLVRPDHTVASVPQVCDEPKGHAGPHKSSTKVITSNLKKEN